MIYPNDDLGNSPRTMVASSKHQLLATNGFRIQILYQYMGFGISDLLLKAILVRNMIIINLCLKKTPFT